MPLFVDAWLNDPVVGVKGKPINFVGFGVGNGFPACIPRAGMKIDWCVNLNNVGFFKYPNVRSAQTICTGAATDCRATPFESAHV